MRCRAARCSPLLFAWEAVVRIYDIQPVILPSPSLIVATLIKDWRTLFGSLEVTLSITFEALVAATIGGFLLALVFAQSRVDRARVFSVRRHHAGDPDRRDRAAAAGLSDFG